MPELLFPIYVQPVVRRVISKIRNVGPRLGTIANVVWGVKIYRKGKGKPPQSGKGSLPEKRFHSKVKRRKLINPF